MRTRQTTAICRHLWMRREAFSPGRPQGVAAGLRRRSACLPGGNSKSSSEYSYFLLGCFCTRRTSWQRRAKVLGREGPWCCKSSVGHDPPVREAKNPSWSPHVGRILVFQHRRDEYEATRRPTSQTSKSTSTVQMRRCATSAPWPQLL